MTKKKIDEGLVKVIKKVADIQRVPMSGDFAMCYVNDLALAIQKAGYRKVKEVLTVEKSAFDEWPVLAQK